MPNFVEEFETVSYSKEGYVAILSVVDFDVLNYFEDYEILDFSHIMLYDIEEEVHEFQTFNLPDYIKLIEKFTPYFTIENFIDLSYSIKRFLPTYAIVELELKLNKGVRFNFSTGFLKIEFYNSYSRNHFTQYCLRNYGYSSKKGLRLLKRFNTIDLNTESRTIES